MKIFSAFLMISAVFLLSCAKSDRVELSLVFSESNVTFTQKMPIERGQKKFSASTYQVLRESGVKFEGSYDVDGNLKVKIECKTDDRIESKWIEIELNQTITHTFKSGVSVSINAHRIQS